MAMMIIGIKVRPNMELVSDIEDLKHETKHLLQVFLSKELKEEDLKMDVQDLAFGIKEIEAAFMAPDSVESSDLEKLFEESEKVESMTVTRFELARG